jgi:hypothetical protein
MAHTAVNPSIYVWQNKRLRAGFAYVLRWVPGVDYAGKHAHHLTVNVHNSP